MECTFLKQGDAFTAEDSLKMEPLLDVAEDTPEPVELVCELFKLDWLAFTEVVELELLPLLTVAEERPDNNFPSDVVVDPPFFSIIFPIKVNKFINSRFYLKRQ